MTEADWRAANTTDLIAEGSLEIGDGYRAKNSEFVPGGGLPFVRVGDVRDGIRTEGLDELPLEKRARYEPKVSQPGDCLITMKGTVGRVAQVRRTIAPFVYSPQISYWRVHDEGRLVSSFLRYWLQGPEFEEQAFATKSATDMADYINLRDQRRMRMTLPGTEEQRRIAAVLAAFDELIDINERRIELLEDLARSLYREWFVHFRFPGHENTEFIDSDLGPSPRGWSVGSLGDLVCLDKGLSYKGVHLTAGGSPMANLKCLSPHGGFQRRGTKSYSGPFKERHAIGAGDLVLANTDLTQAGNVVGSPAVVPTQQFSDGGLISHHLFAVRPLDGRAPVAFLFHVLAHDRFRAFARGRASGTTVLGLRADDVLQYRLVIPPADALDAFDAVAGACYLHSQALLDLNEDLATTRHLLLPRLVTGRLDISDLDLGVLTPAEVE